MAGIESNWISTPNKKDNLTSGWTNKTLFNFQLSNNYITATNGSDVFDTIITNVVNYKGTNLLPTNYFAADNPDDSRTFKITMLFDKLLDGNSVRLSPGLLDVDNNFYYYVPQSVTTGIRNASGSVLAKLEYYCCVYFDNSGNLIMTVNGTAMYEFDGTGTRTTVIEPYVGDVVLTNGTGVEYKLLIQNACGGNITIHSLVVEELG